MKTLTLLAAPVLLLGTTVAAPAVSVPTGASVAAQVSAQGAAFPKQTDAQLYARAAERLAAIDTLQARFIQIAPSRRVSEGTLQLRRPGQLRFDYDDPNPQLIVATGGLVYVHDAALETTDSYPVAQTPLRFLLSERLDTDSAVLERTERSADEVTFILSAADSDLQGRLALTFGAPDLTLRRWAVEEPGGRTTVVELSDLRTGVRLANRDFRAPEAGGAFLRD